MWQYTNTVVVNSDKDSTGLAKWTSVAEDADADIVGSMTVRRVNKYLKPNVVAIHKRAASNPVLGKATFTMVNSGAGIYLVEVYIRLSGSQNSYYANDFVFKGRPFKYEFRVPATSTTPAEMAKEAARVINKIQTLYGDHWIKASVSGNNLVLDCTDEYQLFTVAKILKLDETANNALTNEKWVDAIQGVIVKSKEGFGTYTHILKDLRLPTIESRRFEPTNGEELPVPGVKYNQYTLEYRVDRGLFGGGALGQQVTSQTRHVFYVQEAVATSFEAALANVGTIKEVTK